MRLLIEAGGTAIGVEAGRIVAPDGRCDATLRVPDGTLQPGLINAHDHLHRNHFGRLGEPPYENAYEWGRDIHRRCADTIARGRAVPRLAALLRGAWKNLRAGVTTVVHHDPWEPAFDDAFPIRVVRIEHAHSLELSPALPVVPSGRPFAIHLAEGVDEQSASEVHQLAARGLVTSDLLAVHAVGVDPAGIARLRKAGAAIVWCPSSNLFLLGRTAPPALLAEGIDVLLGSDSLLTADGSLLRELRIARELGLLSDERLRAAVGATAARRLGIEAPLLEIGARADVVVLRKPLLEATESDVAIVIAAGVPRVLDPALVPALVPALGEAGVAGRLEELDGVVRWLGDQLSPGSLGFARARDLTPIVTSRITRS